MTEGKALLMALENSRKHFIPLDKREDYETAIYQCIGDLYKNGYEVVARFKPAIVLGDIEQMKKDEVIY